MIAGLLIGLGFAGLLVLWACLRAAAIADHTHATVQPGDQSDLWLRLDGLTAAVNTAISELADGRLADAQITLGQAANEERFARLSGVLHLAADAALRQREGDRDGIA